VQSQPVPQGLGDSDLTFPGESRVRHGWTW
jgi:hypothetical protein